MTRLLTVRRLLAMLALGALVLPGAALAASARVNGSLLIYRAAPGEENGVAVSYSAITGDSSPVSVTILDAGASIEAGTGCTSTSANEVVCETEGVALSEFRLGDRDDSFTVATACPADYELPFCVLVYGASGDDLLVGSDYVDELYGGEGNDALDGRAGEFESGTVVGDSLSGGAGADNLLGGRDADYLEGGPGADVLRGGRGWDTVTYSRRREPVAADLDGAADDGARGERDRIGADVEDIEGGIRADRLVGNARANALWGNAGNDFLDGRAGADTLLGDTGADVLRGGPQGDLLIGGPASWRFSDGWFVGREPGAGRDLMLGGSGNDSFLASDGKPDRLRGGRGRDRASVDRALDSVLGVERIFGTALAG